MNYPFKASCLLPPLKLLKCFICNFFFQTISDADELKYTLFHLFFLFHLRFVKRATGTHCIPLSGQTLYTTGFRLQIWQNHALLYSCWIIFMRLYLIFTVIWTRNGCTLTSRMLNSYRWPFQWCVHHSHITTVSSLLPTTPESCAVWKSWQMFTLWLTSNSTHWI